QDSIESLKEIINNYETRFQQIESMLAMCCEDGGAKSQDVEINSTTIAIETDGSLLENKTTLNQNNPNPFAYKTTFTYSIGNAGYVELEITDQYGRFIERLVSENQEQGNYSVEWNANDIAPGLYFYSLKVDGMVWVKKAIKIK
ncbi:MAG: T9SS type A sorting domain-containing protein, partial [Bacteroidales bacterium]|nr:T9SS type A sorting domain-containing protein [Bacteroidales bacterium]